MASSIQDDIQVRIQGISRSFREGDQLRSVLKDLNAEFIRGEAVALKGRSGSGKSTLLNIISGIDQPDSGQVEVVGLNIIAMSERDRTLFRRKHIGFVYQAFNLVSTLTVADNIRLVLELNGVSEPEIAERIEELLASIELADRKNSYPDVLSGGEQQRVAIARAIAHRPSLLLVDEPTGNLDDKTTEGVLELLDGLVRQAGGTMIVATHSARVASFCDRGLELSDGVLVAADGRD